MGLRETARLVGGVVGPTLFGLLATFAGYPLTFARGSLLALVAAGVAATGVAESHHPEAAGVLGRKTRVEDRLLDPRRYRWDPHRWPAPGRGQVRPDRPLLLSLRAVWRRVRRQTGPPVVRLVGDSAPESDVETVWVHVAQAVSRAVGPDALAHCHAALRALDPDLGTPLVEYPGCGRVGLPERIAEHECRRARAYRGP